MKWQVKFRIFRYKQDGSQPHFDTFDIEAKPDEYVLDVVERIWAEQDRSLTFRHACHHAACGACGMRLNGREKLACTTRHQFSVGGWRQLDTRAAAKLAGGQ